MRNKVAKQLRGLAHSVTHSGDKQAERKLYRRLKKMYKSLKRDGLLTKKGTK